MFVNFDPVYSQLYQWKSRQTETLHRIVCGMKENGLSKITKRMISRFLFNFLGGSWFQLWWTEFRFVISARSCSTFAQIAHGHVALIGIPYIPLALHSNVHPPVTIVIYDLMLLTAGRTFGCARSENVLIMSWFTCEIQSASYLRGKITLNFSLQNIMQPKTMTRNWMISLCTGETKRFDWERKWNRADCTADSLHTDSLRSQHIFTQRSK